MPCKSVVPPAPHRISMGAVCLFCILAHLIWLTLFKMTPRPHTLTPEKAAELLRLHEAILSKQASSPLAASVSHPASALNNIVTRSPSPTDEDMFDDAIAGLVDFDMDGECMDNKDEGSTTCRSPTPSVEPGKCRHRPSDSDNEDDGQVCKAVKIQESRG